MDIVSIVSPAQSRAISNNPLTPRTVLSESRRYRAAGLSIIPIRTDGSKRTTLKTWAPLQHELPTPADVESWFSANVGIALIGGAVSGNVEILDFDQPGLYEQYEEYVSAQGDGIEWRDLLQSIPCTETPSGGRHLYYRCTEAPEGNKKLAQDADRQTLIETRGEGGYAIVAPSPAACHPDNKPYVLLRGDLAAMPVLTPVQRSVLHHCATMFNQYTPPKFVDAPRPAPDQGVERHEGDALGLRPGDDYDQRGDYESLIERHGAKRLRRTGDEMHWRRPEKDGAGESGTTGYQGKRMLYVFSSNWAPFEPETAYSPFAVYTLLEHGGDYSAAARALYAQGYGERRKVETNRTDSMAVRVADSVSPIEIDSDAEDEDVEEEWAEQDDALSADSENLPDGEIGTDRENEKLPCLLPAIATLWENLPVTVTARGLDIHPTATEAQRKRIFGCAKSVKDETVFWMDFALGDAYNALPDFYGSRVDYVKKHHPGQYPRFRQLGSLARKFPQPLRRTKVKGFYVQAGRVKDPAKREELLNRWEAREFGTLEELKVEVNLIVAAQNEAAERRNPSTAPVPDTKQDELQRIMDAVRILVDQEGAERVWERLGLGSPVDHENKMQENDGSKCSHYNTSPDSCVSVFSPVSQNIVHAMNSVSNLVPETVHAMNNVSTLEPPNTVHVMNNVSPLEPQNIVHVMNNVSPLEPQNIVHGVNNVSPLEPQNIVHAMNSLPAPSALLVADAPIPDTEECPQVDVPPVEEFWSDCESAIDEGCNYDGMDDSSPFDDAESVDYEEPTPDTDIPPLVRYADTIQWSKQRGAERADRPLERRWDMPQDEEARLIRDIDNAVSDLDACREAGAVERLAMCEQRLQGRYPDLIPPSPNRVR